MTSMTWARLLLAFTLVCAVFPQTPQHAQNDDVLTRESDERAGTKEERRRALTTLLAAASQLRDNADRSDWLQAAGFLNRAGRLQIRLNLSQDALATYKEALTLLQQAPSSPVHVDTLNGIGAAYGHLSKCDEAQNYWQQAIALSEQTGYVAGKAEALLVESDCENYGDHVQAVRTAQASLALWQSINNKSGMARTYASISGYQIAQTNLLEAVQSSEAALQIWRELDIPHEQAEALINLGYIEYGKGAWQNSFSFYTQAQALIDEKAESYLMGRIKAGIAEGFIESGLPEIGLGKLQEAQEFYRQAESPLGVVGMTWDIGKTYYLLGDYKRALTTLQQAITDAEAIKSPTLVAHGHDFLGRTHYATNDPAAALRDFEIALTLYEQVGSTREAASMLALMGQVYQRQGQVEKAREYYQNALKSFLQLSDLVNQSATLYALGSLELDRKNLDQAEDYLRRSIDVTEDIWRVSDSRDLTAAFSASVHDRYENYIDCIMRKPSESLAIRAFEISELARGRSLAELLNATQTNLGAGMDPQLATREQSLRQALRVREDSKVALLAGAYKKDELQLLDAELEKLRRDFEQVRDTIRARYPSYDQISRPAPWSLSQIQKQVIGDDETLLLEYSLGKEKSYVWAVTRDGFKSYELPAQERINQAAQKVYGLLTAANAAQSENELDQAARELGRMVLSPVAGDLNKRRIIVVADGTLNYIPFQFLIAPGAGNEPLVANYEIINAPSASILGQLRAETARRRAPTKVLAAFGDPVFESNYAQKKGTSDAQLAVVSTPKDLLLPRAVRGIAPEGDSVDPATIQPLFYSRLELANLRAIAGTESLMVTGFEATRERLAAVNLSEYAILHIATHGFLDPKRPEKSGLFLSMVDRQGQPQNGVVGLEDIYGLHAPVDLVVLSACRTGLGKEVRGEGLIGLTRGFMYAGASSVMASLWKVDDEATAELMKRLYANMLQKGMTPAAALRAAQNSIRQEPQWRSPHYWAAFTLQGEYRQVIKHTPAQPFPALVRIAIAFSLLLLFVAGVWWYRRSGPVNRPPK